MADLSRWFYLALAVPGYGSYLEGATAGSCPKRPVAPRSVQRRVTEDSSHSGKMLTDRTSA